MPPPWGWLAAGVLLGAVVPGGVDTSPPTGFGRASTVVGAALMAAGPTEPAAPTAAVPALGNGLEASSAPAASVPSTAVPASRAVPETTPRPVPRRPAPRVTDAATRSVLGTVQTFGAAWSRLDATSTRRVWPAADGAVLTRAFTGISEQRLTLRGCAVSVDRQDATARCAGTLRYRPRVGDHATQTRYGPWDFTLEKQRAGWVITTVKAPR